MTTTDRGWTAVWRTVTVLVVVSMAASMVPAQDSSAGVLLYLVPVILAVLLCVAGTVRVPRGDRGPWAWVAISQVLFLVGELISARYELSGIDQWPNPAEVFFLSGQVAVVIGVLSINRRRPGVTLRGDILDSAIVAASVGVLAAVFLVLPGLVDQESTITARLVGAAYPIFDVLLVYMMARMILSSSGRATAYWMLLGAQLVMLGADVGWTLVQLITGNDGGDGFPWWANLLWQAGYLLLAVAACTAPGLRAVRPRAAPIETGGLNERRLLVLTIASLAPSMILVVLNVRHGMQNPGWLAMGSILLGCLVTLRVWDLLQQLRAQTAVVARLAAHDSLTGLPNRRSWDQELARACEPGASGSGSGSGAHVVALLDLDRFKDFNDALGHQVGDHLLQAVASAWREALDGAGLLARWGGEEFALLLIDPPLDRATAILDRLRSVVPGGQTCSIGAAVWDGAELPDAVLRRADQALYAAKSSGRNRVVLARRLDSVVAEASGPDEAFLYDHVVPACGSETVGHLPSPRTAPVGDASAAGR